MGSVLFSLLFMAHPIQAAFSQVPLSIFEAAHTLGKSKLTTMIRVILSSIHHGLISEIILAFIHMIGEFGVIMSFKENLFA